MFVLMELQALFFTHFLRGSKAGGQTDIYLHARIVFSTSFNI